MSSTCLFCGGSLAEGAAFCTHCGKSTGAPAFHPPAPTAMKRRLGTASWDEMKSLVSFYGVLLGCSMFFGLLGWLEPGPLGEVVEDSVFISLVLWYLTAHWEKISGAFRWRKPKPRRLVELAILATAVYFFLQFYFWVFEHLTFSMLKITETFTKAHWPLWAILGIISVEPGIFEEIAFRGILQTKLSRILSVKEALLIQAALFSILHLSPAIFVSHFVMGLLLGWARFRFGHIYFGMALHMCWNAYCVFQELGIRI